LGVGGWGLGVGNLGAGDWELGVLRFAEGLELRVEGRGISVGVGV
jgi:hypothetical protein